ncbi:MAG: lipocalin-like domain-containing protein [Acidobacteriota bacterium]
MRSLLIALSLLCAGLLAIAWMLLQPASGPAATVDVAEALSSAEAGYQRITEPRPLLFPADHGPHPDTQNEWWYFTGHLESADGRPFGFQLTIFRTALAPPDARTPQRPSTWAADQLYMGHFSLADISRGEFHAFERFGRGSAGLAGAEAEPFRVWVGPWSAATASPDGGDLWPLRLTASGDDPALTLELTATTTKPAVLHGDAGYSEKGSTTDSGSMYVSFTRLEVGGLLRLDGETLPVQGSAWMDHEWGSAVLGQEHQGWDWFSIQLEDGRELMLFQLRRRDGTLDPKLSGTLIAADGSSRTLDTAALRFEVEDTWKANDRGARYPSRWTLHLPTEEMVLHLRPRIPDQELKVSARYWEGAVLVSGQSAGEAVSGRGYVEMTGYAGESSADS